MWLVWDLQSHSIFLVPAHTHRKYYYTPVLLFFWALSDSESSGYWFPYMWPCHLHFTHFDFSISLRISGEWTVAVFCYNKIETLCILDSVKKYFSYLPSALSNIKWFLQPSRSSQGILRWSTTNHVSTKEKARASSCKSRSLFESTAYIKQMLKFSYLRHFLKLQTARSFLTLCKGQLRNTEETAFLSWQVVILQ